MCGGKVQVSHMMVHRCQATQRTYEVISCRFAVTNQTGGKENERGLATGFCRGGNCDIGGRLWGAHEPCAGLAHPYPWPSKVVSQPLIVLQQPPQLEFCHRLLRSSRAHFLRCKNGCLGRLAGGELAGNMRRRGTLDRRGCTKLPEDVWVIKREG